MENVDLLTMPEIGTGNRQTFSDSSGLLLFRHNTGYAIMIDLVSTCKVLPKSREEKRAIMTATESIELLLLK